MSSELAIKVSNLSKCFHVYEQPQDRLKQLILPRLRNVLGLERGDYKRDFWALSEINFEVKKGESVGILGRNGSGKSTLLQLICGTLTPTTGEVEVNGRVAALLELGSGFNPEFTGRENVYLNGSLLGFSREQMDQRFDAIAAFADIGDFVEQPVKTYSSGMMVRLAFAVQVQVDPDILIIDEALAVGDALFQKRCFQRIESLVNDGVTLLFVSHDIESVRTLTNRALLLKRGVQNAWGPSAAVIREYRRQLHDDETAYYAGLVQQVSEKVQHEEIADAVQPACTSIEATNTAAQRDLASEAPLETRRTDHISFGDGEAQVIRVQVFDQDGQTRTVFASGESVRVTVTCQAHVALTHLNVALRIRNKEGVKIYSWGTLNQDMAQISNGQRDTLFWNKSFRAGELFTVNFEFSAILGTNLYEVQAAVSYEDTPDYVGQRILHWVDEAAFFQTVVDRDVNFFGGVVDLRMISDWGQNGNG